MAIEIIRCPNCGGDVNINDKKCPYCQSDFFNKDFEKWREMIRRMLYSAENELNSGSYDRCLIHLQDVVRIDNDCSDAWFMHAVVYSEDPSLFNQYLQKGRASKTHYGIFSEKDIGKYVKSNKEEAQEIVDHSFRKTFISILIIGAVLSIVLGAIFKTIVPAIIVIVILALVIIAHFVLTWMCDNLE